jgi:foldase protein PrsA
LENENASVKKQSKGLIIGLAVAAVVIIAAVILFVLQPWAVNVASVDNLKITKYEYTFFTKFNMSQFLSSNSINSTPEQYKWNTKVGTETAKDQVKKSTLENIQEFKIQLIKAKDAGIKLDATDLKNVDDAINQQITQYGSRNAAEAGVKTDYGITLSELKEIYRNLTLTQKYRADLLKDVKVSDEDVKKYYDDNKKNFDKVTVTHILIKTVDDNNAPVSEGKKAEAKKKADDILARVRAGEDVKKLATEFSEDKPAVTTKDSPGYEGEYTFGRGEMVSEFEKWAFDDARKEGDSDVVETQFGFHVMQFHKRTETSFDDLKESIKPSLLQQKQTEEYSKKLDEFKKDSKYAVKTNEGAVVKTDKSLYGI